MVLAERMGIPVEEVMRLLVQRIADAVRDPHASPEVFPDDSLSPMR
jgi:hypothetical protein